MSTASQARFQQVLEVIERDADNSEKRAKAACARIEKQAKKVQDSSDRIRALTTQLRNEHAPQSQ